jgi:hypothetical protein
MDMIRLENNSTYYVIGHGRMQPGPSMKIPNKNTIIMFGKCGDLVVPSLQNIGYLTDAFFKTPQLFPKVIHTKQKFEKLKHDLLHDESGYKIKITKFHNQFTDYCAHWFIGLPTGRERQQGDDTIRDNDTCKYLIVMKSGLYKLDPSIVRGETFYLKMDVVKDRPIMISRENINNIYEGAIFPDKKLLDNIFGSDTEINFEIFKIILQRKINEFGIGSLMDLVQLTNNSTIITTTCRAVRPQENLNARLASSSDEERRHSVIPAKTSAKTSAKTFLEASLHELNNALKPSTKKRTANTSKKSKSKKNKEEPIEEILSQEISSDNSIIEAFGRMKKKTRMKKHSKKKIKNTLKKR